MPAWEVRETERALLPLLALVSLGPVVSPQHVLWIATLAALLTRVTYPAPGTRPGSPALPVGLVVRNLLLVGGLGVLAVRTLRARSVLATRTPAG